jgi:hypothetical protein
MASKSIKRERETIQLERIPTLFVACKQPICLLSLFLLLVELLPRKKKKCKNKNRKGSVVVLVLRVIRHIIHSSLYTTTTHTGGGGGGGVRDDSGSYRGAHDRGDDSDGCSILTLTSTSTLIWWFEPNSPVKGSPNIKGSFFLSKNSYMKFHRRNKKKKNEIPRKWFGEEK